MFEEGGGAGEEEDGLVGAGSADLAPLLLRRAVSGSVPLEDGAGRAAGSVAVRVWWADEAAGAAQGAEGTGAEGQAAGSEAAREGGADGGGVWGWWMEGVGAAASAPPSDAEAEEVAEAGEAADEDDELRPRAGRRA